MSVVWQAPQAPLPAGERSRSEAGSTPLDPPGVGRLCGRASVLLLEVRNHLGEGRVGDGGNSRSCPLPAGPPARSGATRPRCIGETAKGQAMNHEPGIQRLSQALQNYEQRCHWFAEQAVDMFRTTVRRRTVIPHR